MADVHYHIERPGSRARYIIPHLIGRMAGWEAREVVSLEEFRSVEGPKLVYGETAVDGAFRVVPQGLLESTELKTAEPVVVVEEGLPRLFPSGRGDLPFDLFAGAFFLLSRMEEYGDLPRDRHGRPVTARLHAARHGYLQRPVVDEWLTLLAGAWRTADPALPPMQRRYGHTATMDVDNGAMYLGREWWRSAGGAARDLLKGRFRRVAHRLAVIAGKKPDPYAVHQRFLDMAEAHGARAIVNFMAAGRGVHDHALPLAGDHMRAVVRSVAARAEVGLHPGYHSSDIPANIAGEKQLLESVVGRPVTCSRQHFLRLRVPDTLRALDGLGIREEHSMGMSDSIGFRAGTCTPFPFYDLGREQALPLIMHPFAVMDSTLAYQMRLGPAGAVAAAKRMVDAVRAVNGTFISVWHERFLSGYGDEVGWGGVVGEVLQYARP